MIAIIPARGGSKRIHRKNIKSFLGTPIILRTIKKLEESSLFSRLIVSTDDDEIANIAERAGAEVLVRNSILANDHATTQEVITNSLLQIREEINFENDLICCVYPVTPFLDTHYVENARKILIKDDLDYVFTAKLFEASPSRALKLSIENMSEMVFPENLSTRTQDLPAQYHDAAMFYLGRAKAWLKGTPVLHGKSKFIVIGKYESVDVDDEDDWNYAEELFRIRNKIGSKPSHS